MKKVVFLLLIGSAIVFLLINARSTHDENQWKSNHPIIYHPHKLSDLGMLLNLHSTKGTLSDSAMDVKYQWPYGSSFAVYSTGDYLFSGFGAGINIYKINDGINMTYISTIPSTSRILKILQVENNLFVANQLDGVKIYDINNLYEPALVSTVPVSYGANDLDVKGNYLYLSDGWYGGNPGAYEYLFQGRFKIIDITDIQNPNVVIDWDMGGEVTGVCVEGAYVYVVFITYSMWDGSHTKLAIYDISDPTNPVGQTTMELGSPGSYTNDQGDVAVKGTYAYVTSRWNGIKQIDISNIQAPFVYQTINLFGKDAFRVEQFDTTLLVTTKDSGIAVIGIKEPSSPIITRFIALEGTKYDASYNNGFYFTSCGNMGVKIIKAADNLIINNLKLGNEITDILENNGQVYVCDGDLGIKIFQNEIDEMTMIGSWSNEKRVGALAKLDNYLYVSQLSESIKILDVSNPANPITINTIPVVQNNVSDLTTQENRLYVLQSDSGLTVYDLVDPIHPIKLGSFNPQGIKWRIKVMGDYGYVASDANGFIILNVSDPAGMYVEGFYDPTGNVYDVAIKTGKAFLAAGSQGLLILDISDPSAPNMIGSMPTVSQAIGIAMKDSMLSLTTSFDRMQAYVESPSGALTLIGYYGSSGLRNEIFWGSDYCRPAFDANRNILLGCGSLGFVKLNCITPGPPIASTDSTINITDNSAILFGTVNANNAIAAITFEYGTTSAYGIVSAGNPNFVSGNDNTIVNSGLTNLVPNQLYHYRIKAINSFGTTLGNDKYFTTLSKLPFVTTNDATNITHNSATLNGIINPENALTDVVFEYGLTISYDHTVTATQSPVSGIDNQEVTFVLSGLDPSQTYHYRVTGTNLAGTAYGNDKTFTTATYGIEDIINSNNPFRVLNIPNPFSDITKITFINPKYQLIKITIYNSRGEQIEVLVNENRHAGLNEVVFSGSSLHDGIYYAVIQAGYVKEVRKIIFMR